MRRKIGFLLPLILGLLFSLGTLVHTGWETDIWLMPLTVGALISIAIFLSSRIIVRDGLVKVGSRYFKAKYLPIILELVFFVCGITLAILPGLEKRRVFIDGYTVSERSVVIFVALFGGVCLIIRVVRWLSSNLSKK